ncbi:hypothetical protein SAMN04487857_12430 [Pseudomonas sp. ok272]|uniref:hypothetical protein n=1 Tax=unclassified Pseudomonas TaxID=196821 RepID=UPI0008C5DDEF|nr:MULTISPECIES: hypothetical protein [unclassified Pseudomonas]SEN58993.1 hypothetical protein SAMN04487857_12430 [Pseudomonas sp. ok272]SFN37455.1 hypothetical protein SAMN04487858_12311 [Pseudomonas sp. ok602]
MKLHTLTKAIMLATVLSSASLTAYAAQIPLSNVVQAEQVNTKVISVDAANHVVVVEGADGQPVSVQLSDKAKDLGNLKAGDKVQVDVIRSVAVLLDTTVDKGQPGTVAREGEVRATADNPNPGGEAYRQVKVELQITKIDLKHNQVTLKNPAGVSKVLDVKDPKVQAKLKDLKEGQSVVVTYTDVLKVSTSKG